MATALDALNKLGLLTNKPILKPCEIEAEKNYPIIDIRNVEGEFGAQTLVELAEGLVYLPKRMTMSEGVVESLNHKQLALVFRGMKYIKKFKKETPLFEIVENWGSTEED